MYSELFSSAVASGRVSRRTRAPSPIIEQCIEKEKSRRKQTGQSTKTGKVLFIQPKRDKTSKKNNNNHDNGKQTQNPYGTQKIKELESE